MSEVKKKVLKISGSSPTPATAGSIVKAYEEGFHDIAETFRKVGEIEKRHEERYRRLLNDVKMKSVFEKSSLTIWECRVCGHIVVGTKAPDVCPVCKYSQAYFEVHKG